MKDEDSIRDHFEDFLDATQVSRRNAERRRDYKDLKQWTSEEAKELEGRGQAPIVYDLFAKKIDGIVGMEIQRRTDPKALPVKPRHEKAADAITDALRFVESKTFFDNIASEVFEDKLVEGCGAVITEVDDETKEIKITRIPWDRYYFDPHSRKADFSDKRYDGITIWMDLDVAQDMFPKSKDQLAQLIDATGDDGTTYEDRPSNWIDTKRKRVRINQEYYKDGDKWIECFYCGDTILKKGDSPYLDDKGKPCNPIESQSDFVDRGNNRYGWAERLMDPQDEINHRRSKALYMLSHVSVQAEEGAFLGADREAVLTELSKGKSFVEYSRGAEITIDRQQELGQAQIALYQDAFNAMDSVGTNPELNGSTDSAVSGRAFIARQQSGMTEIASILSKHSEWKVRVYRQMFSRMKQYWTEERWIRVTGEQQAMRFVGLNIPITAIEKQMEDMSNTDIETLRSKAGAEQVDQMIQAAIQQNPAAGRVVETRNNVKELDMDIIIEEAPDSTVLRDEQFQVLAQLAGSRADPQMFKALLMLSSVPNKDEVIAMFEDEPDEAQKQLQQMQAAQQELNMQGQQAENQKTQAEAAKIASEIPLNQAKTKDELASATERVHKMAFTSS